MEISQFGHRRQVHPAPTDDGAEEACDLRPLKRSYARLSRDRVHTLPPAQATEADLGGQQIKQSPGLSSEG